MAYLLDTCCISDIVRGDAASLQRFKSCNPGELAISTITQMEVAFGLAKNPVRAGKIAPFIKDVYRSIHILPFDSEAAELAGKIRHDLQKQGTPIGAYDLLIAAAALDHGYTLVTSNVKEFSHVSALKIDNWRE